MIEVGQCLYAGHKITLFHNVLQIALCQLGYGLKVIAMSLCLCEADQSARS